MPVLPTEFAFRPAKAALALREFDRVSNGPQILTGPQLAQGSMLALYQAEYLAAEAGVVPFTVIEGQRGILNIGAARAIIDTDKWTPKPGVDVEALRIAYLGAHGAVRQAHVLAQQASSDTPLTLPSGEAEIGLIQIPIAYVVAVTVVAVASVVAGAWYLGGTAEQKIRSEAANLRQISAASAIVALAEKEFATTGKWPAAAYDALAKTAQTEREAGPVNWIPWVVGGAIVVGAGALAYKLAPRLRGLEFKNPGHPPGSVEALLEAIEEKAYEYGRHWRANFNSSKFRTLKAELEGLEYQAIQRDHATAATRAINTGYARGDNQTIDEMKRRGEDPSRHDEARMRAFARFHHKSFES